MTRRVLITGGAGFIGSHLADELLRHGDAVCVLDSLDPQVHGEGGRRPPYIDAQVELLRGDVRSPDDVARALRGVDAVYHLAAAVGVGQSMYQISRYTEVNDGGTATLLEALAERPVGRLIVASSMSVYGEGLYRSAAGEIVHGAQRPSEQLRRREWEVRSASGEPLAPEPTPEWKHPVLASVYALNKFAQERMCLIVGEAYGIPTVALRFFNVYGPRQALSNPYTGVLAIFASRLLNGQPPLVFEDGLQQRDFVSVRDVARACRLALDRDRVSGLAVNVGSGRPRTVLDVAESMARAVGRPRLRPRVTGRFRAGDIRHCFADITAARSLLGFEPEVPFEKGLEDLASWLEDQPAVDRADEAGAELARRGLAV